MRLVTYNIRKGKGPHGSNGVELAQIGEAVRSLTADLLLFQEVFHCARTGTSQSGELGDVLGLRPHYGANKYRSAGHHGNTIFSSFPVERVENYDISTNPIERRGALYMRARFEGRPLHVLNVHLGLNGFQRSAQLKMIAAIIDKVAAASDAVILAGDFNDWRQRLERRVVEELGLCNALSQASASAPPKTWHARRPVWSLDRIYLRNLRVIRSGCLHESPWPTLSDHLPLFADLAWEA